MMNTEFRILNAKANRGEQSFAFVIRRECIPIGMIIIIIIMIVLITISAFVRFTFAGRLAWCLKNITFLKVVFAETSAWEIIAAGTRFYFSFEFHTNRLGNTNKKIQKITF